jgi:hypothetical protein
MLRKSQGKTENGVLPDGCVEPPKGGETMWKSVKYILALSAIVATFLMTCTAIVINAVNAK